MSGFILPGSVASERHLPAAPAALAGGSHAYWRLEVLATGGTAFATLGNLQFLDGHGSLDLAVGGTPMSSGDYALGAAFRAFDGDLTTYWRGAATGWIGYQFASPVAVNVVKLGMPLDPTLLGEAPTFWRLQWSDNGIAWTTALQVGDGAGYATGEHRTYLTAAYVAARAQNAGPASIHGPHLYWQLQLLDVQTAPLGLSELAMRATPGGTDQCTGGTPIASSAYNTPATKPISAFDGNSASFWQALSGAQTETIGYQFSKPTSVVEVAITAAHQWQKFDPDPYTAPANTPLRALIMVSDDGSRWTAAWMYAHEQVPPHWSDGEIVASLDPSYYVFAPMRLAGATLSTLASPPTFFRADKVEVQTLAQPASVLRATALQVQTIATGGGVRANQTSVEVHAGLAEHLIAAEVALNVQATPAHRVTVDGVDLNVLALTAIRVSLDDAALNVLATPRLGVRASALTVQIISAYSG